MAFKLAVTHTEAARRTNVSLEEVERRVAAGTLRSVLMYESLVWLDVDESEMPKREEHLIPEKETEK